VAAIETLDNAPRWLREFGRLNYDEVSRLPKLDTLKAGHFSAPVARKHVVANDYLDFLREQVRLNARGPAWTAVLQRRLDALQAYRGRKVLDVNLHRWPESATLYIEPESGNLLYAEFH